MEHLFEIKKTQIEMIQDRGYDVKEEELALLTHDFRYFLDYLQSKTGNKGSRSALSQVYSLNGEKYLSVNFLEKSQDSKQISIEVVRAAVEEAKNSKANEILIIIEIPLSSRADNSLVISGLGYQVFFDKDLSYNITRHVDTPRHELLTPEETEEKLKELKADITKLLIIKANDPIVQYYNWPIGRVVRIYREDYVVSILSPKSINYRVISN